MFDAVAAPLRPCPGDQFRRRSGPWNWSSPSITNGEEAYLLPEVDGPEGSIADWEPLVRAVVLEDRNQEVGVERISARFHKCHC